MLALQERDWESWKGNIPEPRAWCGPKHIHYLCGANFCSQCHKEFLVEMMYLYFTRLLPSAVFKSKYRLAGRGAGRSQHFTSIYIKQKFITYFHHLSRPLCPEPWRGTHLDASSHVPSHNPTLGSERCWNPFITPFPSQVLSLSYW